MGLSTRSGGTTHLGKEMIERRCNLYQDLWVKLLLPYCSIQLADAADVILKGL